MKNKKDEESKGGRKEEDAYEKDGRSRSEGREESEEKDEEKGEKWNEGEVRKET